MNIPLCRPCVDDAEIDAVAAVLRGGWYAHGAANTAFEQAFTELLGVEHAVSLNSCTSALFLALMANRIRGEVIIPAFTWVATANAVVTAGATPVFADIEPAGRMLDPEAVEAAITPRTEAIIAVHYAGQCANMWRLTDIARRHRLLLIEDSAETLGATHHGRQAGAFGIGCFSFFPTKNITTGEGGMLTCRDGDLAAQVRTLASHGVTTSTLEREKHRLPWAKQAAIAGFNFRMSNILAAIGVQQMKKLSGMNGARQRLAMHYEQRLAGCEAITVPAVLAGNTHVYQMYTLLVPADQRDKLVAALNAQGIGASVHFAPPVHRHPAYHGLAPGQPLPVTEDVAARSVTLPIYPGMTLVQADMVADAVLAYLEAGD